MARGAERVWPGQAVLGAVCMQIAARQGQQQALRGEHAARQAQPARKVPTERRPALAAARRAERARGRSCCAAKGRG